MKVETSKENLYAMPVRMRIWDDTDKKWVRSEFNRADGYVKEFFISQNGDLWLHESDASGNIKLTPESNLDPNRYFKNFYTGAKDKDGNKYYFNDIVKFTHAGGASFGVLIWSRDCLAIGSGPINNYTAEDQIHFHELAQSEKAGNIYENASIIMG